MEALELIHQEAETVGHICICVRTEKHDVFVAPLTYERKDIHLAVEQKRYLTSPAKITLILQANFSFGESSNHLDISLKFSRFADLHVLGNDIVPALFLKRNMNDDTLLHIMMRQHGSFPNYSSDTLSLLESDEIVSLLTSRNKQDEKPIDFVLNADKCCCECYASFSRLAQHDNTAIHKILTYRDELGDTVLHSLNWSEHIFVLKAICEHYTESNRRTI